MRKSLIIPILGLVILGISAFVFLNKNEGTGNKDIALPSSLFNTADFYDMKTLNQKELDDVYIVNFLHHGANPAWQNIHCSWNYNQRECKSLE